MWITYFYSYVLYICEMIEFMNIHVHYVINGTPMFVQVRSTLPNIYNICHSQVQLKKPLM